MSIYVSMVVLILKQGGVRHTHSGCCTQELWADDTLRCWGESGGTWQCSLRRLQLLCDMCLSKVVTCHGVSCRRFCREASVFLPGWSPTSPEFWLYNKQDLFPLPGWTGLLPVPGLDSLITDNYQLTANAICVKRWVMITATCQQAEVSWLARYVEPEARLHHRGGSLNPARSPW